MGTSVWTSRARCGKSSSREENFCGSIPGNIWEAREEATTRIRDPTRVLAMGTEMRK